MDSSTIGGIIGVAGTFLGVVAAKGFEMLQARSKAALDREDYMFRFFFNKRAEFLMRLFEIYAEAYGKVGKACLLEGDAEAVLKAYQPVHDFLVRGLIYPSVEIVEIAFRFQNHEMMHCKTPEDIIVATTKTYQDLKNAIRAELGEKYFPDPPER